MWLFSKRHLKVIGNVAELRKTGTERERKSSQGQQKKKIDYSINIP